MDRIIRRPGAKIATVGGVIGLLSTLVLLVDLIEDPVELHFGMSLWWLKATVAIVTVLVLATFVGIGVVFEYRRSAVESERRRRLEAKESESRHRLEVKYVTGESRRNQNQLRKHLNSVLDRVSQSEERRRTPRVLQRDAFQANASVYGFAIKEMLMAYTIYSKEELKRDGSAHSYHKYTFECSRPLRNFSRSVGSTIGQPAVAEEVTLNKTPENVEVSQQTENEGKHLKEVFAFRKQLQPGNKEVLEFYCNHENHTFLAAYSDAEDRRREFDWVGFELKHPVETLSVSITFDGFRPDGDPTLEAFWGSGKLPLPQETVDAEPFLNVSRDAGKLQVKLQLNYPIIGVYYRIKWRLAGAPRRLELPAVASGVIETKNQPEGASEPADAQVPAEPTETNAAADGEAGKPVPETAPANGDNGDNTIGGEPGLGGSSASGS